jgi:hypothetical protein
MMKRTSYAGRILLSALSFTTLHAAQTLPANRWTEVAKDSAGARPGSAIRYVPEARLFFLWGYMNDDPDLLQEQPLMQIPEYDVVTFDAAGGRWRNHLPPEWAELWTKRLPLAYVPRTYSGITSGSERTVLRGATAEQGAAPRPDLNIVFDQAVYAPALQSLVYFTGGLTAAYNITRRHWTDLAPAHSPPPVLGGSLAYDPLHDEIVLFGGGHVAERGPDGNLAGYTGTWIYSARDWRELPRGTQPPPRMNTRMVTDTRHQALVLFGGDGQSHYLADTWLFDLKTRTWRQSKAPGGPAARAGHFTVYDPETGWVIIGGGYNHRDLTDMWAYDASADRWQRLAGDVPAGFYLTADIAPEQRLILLATSTRKPDDRMTCNVLFPVRTTYAFRIDQQSILQAGDVPPQPNMPKRPAPINAPAQVPRLDNLPENRWVLLSNPGRTAPTRTWGSATFDTDREQILYWGGGHCGYSGSDVDMYDVAEHTWRPGDTAPEYPERLWNNGVREAGVTFGGRPWMEHGRRTYAYDPVSHKMILMRRVRLTTGYEPPLLRGFPERTEVAPDALVRPPSSYVKFTTWSFDPQTSVWGFDGPAPAGVDTLVSTSHGVMGINVDWPARLNDAGYQWPWTPDSPHQDTAIYLYRARDRRWERLNSKDAPSPQNLYELTSLAYDTKRDQVILHGGGMKRDELWTFDFATRQWQNKQPRSDSVPPACSREAVYLPRQDLFLTYGDGVWTWKPADNTWRRIDIPFDGPRPEVGQNVAMVYDPKRDITFLVLGERGDLGLAQVYALRYKER